jgi:dephospho-CoA kinase
MPYLLGLTGSIGMGKTTTTAMFADAGIAVWDADAAVHRLYAPNGAAVAPISAIWPHAAQNWQIDRPTLKSIIGTDPTALPRIESIVHPLVAIDRAQFIATTKTDIALLDIPLLFENQTETTLNATLLVTAPPALQKSRVLARPGMTDAHFQTILARQMPDAEKRKRATHIIETLDIIATRACVTALIAYIRKLPHA